MEAILVGTTYWTRFQDMPWHKVDFSEEELEELAQQMPQMEAPVQVDEQTPLDDSIEWLMSQPNFKLAEGSLTEAGTEEVNGINCRHYTVDSTYSYKVTYTAPITASAEITELRQGDIWLADQGDWPAFLVRAQLIETTTTQVQGGESSTEVQWLAQDVFDVNSPDIVIQAPE